MSEQRPVHSIWQRPGCTLNETFASAVDAGRRARREGVNAALRSAALQRLGTPLQVPTSASEQLCGDLRKHGVFQLVGVGDLVLRRAE